MVFPLFNEFSQLKTTLFNSNRQIILQKSKTDRTEELVFKTDGTNRTEGKKNQGRMQARLRPQSGQVTAEGAIEI